MITYFQAIIIGLIQGVTELFPISSLGHSILIAKLFGWDNLLSEQAAKSSTYLTFIVGLHVATALALFIFYRKTWYRLFNGFISSIQDRKITTVHQKLAWLLIVATIPAGIVGLLLESKLRTLFAVPAVAAVLLIINGYILLRGDKKQMQLKSEPAESVQVSTKNAAVKISFPRALVLGVAQSSALLAGISRSGVTMVTGLYSGLSVESAARFSFLLATPIIFLAGVYKLPALASSADRGIVGQTLVGAIVAGVAAYICVRFLDKYFQNKRMLPFAIYCFIFGGFMLIYQIFF